MPPPPIQVFLTTIVSQPQLRQRQGSLHFGPVLQRRSSAAPEFTDGSVTRRVHTARAAG